MLKALRTGARDLIAQIVANLVPAGVLRDQRYFELWQSRGYHIMPVHFYNPIPDTRDINEHVFNRQFDLAGVDLNEPAQLRLLSDFGDLYRPEYEADGAESYSIPDWGVLYCMIRHFKPRRIIEIGSGESTKVAAKAVLKNQAETGIEAKLIAIEPSPARDLVEGFPGLCELRAIPVQEVPLSEFLELGENDILFIDSSHMLKIGSDVHYEYLEIIPRLRRGVILHIHDIFLPYDYPRELVKNRFIFWNEAYLLQAFLSFNSAFEVLWSSSYLHHRHPEALKRAFTRYRPANGVPSSFWMRRIAD
ncbi:MAG: class I SAM-dependent methyltransferase [Isosphaeraceae bacterium]